MALVRTRTTTNPQNTEGTFKMDVETSPTKARSTAGRGPHCVGRMGTGIGTPRGQDDCSNKARTMDHFGQQKYFRWAGHAVRATSSMLSTTVTADLHRRQGRPPTHWLSPIEALHRSRGAPRNHPWHACALDRELWASMTDDFLDFIHSEKAPAELRWSLVMDELG